MASSQALPQALREWAHIFMRRTMGDFSHSAREAGLSMAQFGVLHMVYRNNGQAISSLGEDLGVTSAAASQMIERLVQQGLLERCEDPRDRRVRQVALTARGRELVEHSTQARRSWTEGLTRVLSPEEQKQIAAALHRLAEAAEELEKQP